MLFALFISHALAASCPVAEKDIWLHYADEWGHEEKPVHTLKRQQINIGKFSGQWMISPKTCTKETCDVTFVLKLKNGCWKPLLSVQGKVKPLKKGDWSTFNLETPRSSVDKSKTRDVIWVFDPKELKFGMQVSPAT